MKTKRPMPLDDVCYMLRSVVVEDESRIDDSKYLSQVTKGYRQIIEDQICQGRHKIAANLYLSYFLQVRGNYVEIKERVPEWAKEFEWEDGDYAKKLKEDMLGYLKLLSSKFKIKF